MAETGAFGCAMGWFFRECRTRLNHYCTSWNVDSFHMKPGGTCGHPPKPKTRDTSSNFVWSISRMLSVHSTICERNGPFVVVRAVTGWVVFLCVAFGFACGPLLWGRLAAFAARMSQSLVAAS